MVTAYNLPGTVVPIVVTVGIVAVVDVVTDVVVVVTVDAMVFM